MTRRLVILVFGVVALCVTGGDAVAEEPPAADPPPRPSPQWSAQEVIELQLRALQTAGDPEAPADAGMATVFAFASPANRQQTGPLERFDAMVRQPPYDALVGHVRHQVVDTGFLDAEGQPTPDPDAAVGVRALIAVERPGGGDDDEGEVAWFVWVVAKQTAEPYVGCWMSELVAPTAPPPPPADPPPGLV